MKKLIFFVSAILAVIVSGCRYDDSALWNSVYDLDSRVSRLEKLCSQINTNVNSLQTVVYALQDNDYVTGVNPYYEEGELRGYTISFTKSPTITIYHGKDGINGTNGSDGINGQDGKDGYTPLIGVKQDTDGHYYWTLDGEWLLDHNGNKVLAEGAPGKDGKDGINGIDGKDGQDGKDGLNGADGKDGKDGKDGLNGADGKDGKDGITPQFKIVDGDWYISLDNGLTWQYLGRAQGADGKDGQDGKDGLNGADGKDGQDGKDGLNGADGKDGQDGKDGLNGANGKDGKDGDSMFSSINTSDPDFVIFTLADGTQIKLPTWYAFEALKQYCSQLNTNIQSLQTIVNAMEAGDYIVSTSPLMQDGVEIGYTITFAKRDSVIIYHGKNGLNGADGKDGKDGKDGVNGTNGADGKDGKDGHTPVIGVQRDNDNNLYWTIDGKWMLDDNGKKVPVTGKDGKDGTNGSNGANGLDGKDGADGSNGKDGVTPQFKIQEEYWYISYDNGDSWTRLGRATGEKGADGRDGQNGSNGKDGKDGDSVFSSVTQDDNYLYLTLTGNGEIISIPKNKPFSITFDREEFTVQPGKTYKLNYKIIGADSKTQINLYEKNGLTAEVTKTSNSTGYIEITAPSSMTPKSVHELIVLVNNGYDRTLMQTLTFVKGIGRVTNYSVTANSNDRQAHVTLTTNLDSYTLEIPDDAKDWLSQAPATRAQMREDIITFNIKTNSNKKDRSAVVKVIDMGGNEIENIYILQLGTISKTINVDKNGHLSTAISSADKTNIAYLFLSGNLSSADYSYIGAMTNLKYLDLSECSNTTLPAGKATTSNNYVWVSNSTTPGLKGYFETIILPKALTSIPDYCFFNYDKLKGDLIIPDNVKSIGNWAFYNCSGLSGDLVIGKNVTTIGSGAFAVNTSLEYSPGAIKFANIYCKALTPPNINAYFDNTHTLCGSSFGCFIFSGEMPKSIKVPKGYRNAYLQSDWSLITTIEEVDFDKLGY